jgi:hypothetical protein
MPLSTSGRSGALFRDLMTLIRRLRHIITPGDTVSPVTNYRISEAAKICNGCIAI